MYIYLEDSLVNIDYKKHPKHIDSLLNLISSSINGNNILDAKRKTFQSLMELGIFSEYHCSCIKQIMTFNFDHKETYKDIPYKIYITNRYSSVTKDADKNFWFVPLDLIKYGSFDAIELLGEDLSDAQLLIHAAEHYRKNNKLRGFNISICPRNGGGQNMPINFLSSLELGKNFIVAFCDSDKFSPKGGLGAASSSCKKISENDQILGAFFHTDGREIENDIPFFFIQESLSADTQVSTRLAYLLDLVKNLPQPFIKYLDLKEGLKRSWLSKLGNRSDNQVFWDEIISDLIRLEKISEASEDEIILPSISEKMASSVLAWLEYNTKNTPKNVHQEILNCPSSEAWKKHGETIFWLGCSMKKLRV